jgi:two-component system, LytTR family, response regulator
MDNGVRRLLRETEVAHARTAPAVAFAPAVRIAVRSVGRVVIVPVSNIIRLEACDNYVRIWADRPHLHKETLTGLVARLDPALFVRVHRSHAVNAAFVRELRSHLHGEYTITFADGEQISTGRSYRPQIQQAFGLL